jgi:hypothetical protein
MVTGLLATPEYVRASLAHLPGDHSKAITRKLERQSALYDTSKRFTFILTEQAVGWPFLPALTMAMQLDRLVSISRLPNIRLGVIPLDGHIPVGPLNTFTIYDTRIATVETQTGAMVFRDHRNRHTSMSSQHMKDLLCSGRSAENGCPNGPTSSAHDLYPTTEISTGSAGIHLYREPMKSRPGNWKPWTGRAAGAGDHTAKESPCGHGPCHRRYGDMAHHGRGGW